jgi:hypothetical protein
MYARVYDTQGDFYARDKAHITRPKEKLESLYFIDFTIKESSS